MGPATGDRRIVDAATAFAAYATCDDLAEVGREAYLSAFHYGEDFRTHLDDNGSVRGFGGICWTPWLWIDVDRDELDMALTDTRRLVAFIRERYQLDEDALLIFFSGSKGFHLGLSTALWQPEPSTTFHRITRRFAESISEAAGIAIDRGVYDRVRLFRAPNSRHQKTGRFKRRFSCDELFGISLDAVLRVAEKPAPFDIPVPTGRCELAAADWSVALSAVQGNSAVNARRKADGISELNRSTLSFIREGAAHGDRHRLLFSAAANLAEFGCPPALAHALLSESALNSGLAPSDVSRQIECGLSHKGNVLTPSNDAPDQPARPKSVAELSAWHAANWKHGKA